MKLLRNPPEILILVFIRESLAYFMLLRSILSFGRFDGSIKIWGRKKIEKQWNKMVEKSIEISEFFLNVYFGGKFFYIVRKWATSRDVVAAKTRARSRKICKSSGNSIDKIPSRKPLKSTGGGEQFSTIKNIYMSW